MSDFTDALASHDWGWKGARCSQCDREALFSIRDVYYCILHVDPALAS